VVVRVHPREERLCRGGVPLRVVSQNAKHLVGPKHGVALNVPDPAADVRDALGFDEQLLSCRDGNLDPALLSRFLVVSMKGGSTLELTHALTKHLHLAPERHELFLRLAPRPAIKTHGRSS
jgi:hypothetical protein